MDSIIIILKALWGFTAFKIFLGAWVAFFLFIVVISFTTANAPDAKLYRAGHDGAQKASLNTVRKGYRSHPDRWLLYEEEIFFVKHPEELTGADREAYDAARVRCVNGGSEARQVGRRVRIRRTEAGAYLRFFYGLHKERMKPRRLEPVAEALPEDTELPLPVVEEQAEAPVPVTASEAEAPAAEAEDVSFEETAEREAPDEEPDGEEDSDIADSEEEERAVFDGEDA